MPMTTSMWTARESHYQKHGIQTTPIEKAGHSKAKGGNVYMSDAAIRLAGYQAWELKVYGRR